MNKTKFLKSTVLTICSVSFLLPLYASEFPGNSWAEKNPTELGVDASKVERLFDLSFQDDATQSVVLIKDGYLIISLLKGMPMDTTKTPLEHHGLWPKASMQA